ncbi:HpcH/HpaI aldolase/citrate lyase family protein [Microbacterium pygmaeum]|uniref:Citrate lyase subunit beta / citryl-CoA lyase n=1 Tax=Microbacterium pygmaeum TaxID=370764 RepID=A0A1G7XL56_9MICO|nr:CoA ester lyase [Microbacterium pygmaeum]SDG84806.1 citrate lyase subunit beta / citryl-CoA lyase [Microbacterium pygmaeum]
MTTQATAYFRSMLYVPGDDDRKLAKADGCGADAVVLDLEDSVAPANRPGGRKKVRAFLDARPPEARSYQLWVRINALDESALDDLVAVVGGRPDGIVLPKIDGPPDIHQLSLYLDALETREAVPPGSIKICAVATETPAAVLKLHQFADAHLPRLVALNWGAEDLSAAVGASTNLDSSGRWALTYRWARSAVMLAAKAAGVQAIDTVYVDYRDTEGLIRASRESATEGFTGRVAIHPAQVGPINEVFMPSEHDVRLAQSIVDAFAGNEGVGVVGIDGKMFDIPHLKRAHLVLEKHARFSGDPAR